MFKRNVFLNAMLCCGLSLIVVCKPAAAATEDPVALEKHMAYFADKYSQIHRASIQEKLLWMGVSQEIALEIADKASYIGGLLVKGTPYAEFTGKEGVGKLIQPRSTGIFNADGSINEQRWQKLKTYAEKDGDEDIITKNQFFKFLSWCHDHDTRPDTTGNGKKDSNEQWELFFALATDHWKKMNNDYEQSITLKTLRKFYEDTPAIFDAVAKHQLPVPKPTR